MKRLLLALAFFSIASGAWAQNPTCPTRPLGDASNACASTAYVQNQLVATPIPGFITCSANQFVNIVGASSICAQPSFSNLSGQAAIAQGGTGQGTATLGFQALAPVPTRAGDVIYWNGSAWITLAGNNSGTQILAENSSGVPSWSAAGSGSVTSVTCGTGLSGGTFTTTNFLSGEVSTGAINTYTDGPSIAQGTSGTWMVTGQVTVWDTAGVSEFDCKLWDGTTVISGGSAIASPQAASQPAMIPLSGFLASPVGNIKITCRDVSRTTGFMKFNLTGTSKDSGLSGYRIQ